MVRRESGRSRGGGGRLAAKVPGEHLLSFRAAQQRPPCRHPGFRHLSVPGGKRKNLLSRPSLCRFVHYLTQKDITIPNFHSVNNFSKKLGHISEERNTTLQQGLTSPVENQCRATDKRGFLPTSASVAARKV